MGFSRATLAVLVLVLAPVPGGAAEEAGTAPPEPALCREARALHPDRSPLQALRAEEGERWRRARRAGRAGRRTLRRGIGQADRGGARALAGEFDRVDEAHRRAMREARVLCTCRAARGDPDGADCDRLYPTGPGGPPPPTGAPASPTDGPPSGRDPSPPRGSSPAPDVGS